MTTYDAMLSAAEASGIADYRIVKSAYGYNSIKITYKNGAVIEKPECEECWLNAVSAGRIRDHAGRVIPCLSCLHKQGK